MRYMVSVLGSLLAFAGAPAMALAAPALVVDDDGAECPGAGFTTIQAAVNAASPGARIQVCPGTYAEQVVVSQPLTIRGENGAVVRPVGVAPNTTSLFDGSPIAAIVLAADAKQVVIEGLTVDGVDNGLADCAANFVGVFYRNASGRAAGLAVRNVQLGPGLEGCQSGLAVFVQSGGGGTSQVDIEGSSVHHFQKNGITANEVGSDVRIRGNVVMGRGPGPGAAQNGIQIAFGASGQILENTVANFVWPGCVSVDDCVASASDVLVFDADHVGIARNTLGKSQGGIVVQGDRSSIQGNDVYDTDVFDGIAVLGSDNRVLGNEITRSDEAAVFLMGDDNTVTGNQINEAPIGVWDFAGTGNVIAHNRVLNTPTLVLATLMPLSTAGPGAVVGPFR